MSSKELSKVIRCLSCLFFTLDCEGKQSVNSEGLNICLGKVFVEFSQVEDGQHNAEKID